MVNVAFSASSFSGRNASGTANLARNLVTNLYHHHKNRISPTLLFSSIEEVRTFENTYDLNVKKIILPSTRVQKNSLQFYKYAFDNRQNKQFDIMHFTVPRYYPFYWEFPANYFFCTYHAAGDIAVKHDNFVLSRTIYNFIAKQQWRKMTEIISVSPRATAEIHKYYEIPTKRIKHVFPGTDSLWFLNNESKLKGFDFENNSPYILILGRFQKFKNILNVIKSIDILRKNLLKDIKIIILAKNIGTDYNLVMKILNSWPRTAWEILEFLPEIDYQNILRNAQLVIHPSLNEGFGIPAFEAYGEGARLLIHNQTPAYDLLGNHNGVMSGDLSNLSEITHSIKSALDIQKGSISKRREYLTSIGATWKAMAMNYANLYESYS